LSGISVAKCRHWNGFHRTVSIKCVSIIGYTLLYYGPVVMKQVFAQHVAYFINSHEFRYHCHNITFLQI